MAHFTVKVLWRHLFLHHMARYGRLGDLHWEPNGVGLRVHITLWTIARVWVGDRGNGRAMTRNRWWGRRRRLERWIGSELLL